MFKVLKIVTILAIVMVELTACVNADTSVETIITEIAVVSESVTIEDVTTTVAVTTMDTEVTTVTETTVVETTLNKAKEAPAEFIELIEVQKPQKTKADFDEGNIFDENDYTVTMYYDDFNGDGIYEAFAAKSYWVYIAHTGVKYTEIWYTDGTECVFIDSQESMYVPYLQEKEGKKYVSWTTKVANNATVQLDTYVYTLTNTGEAKKCDCTLEGYVYGRASEKGLVIVSEENTDIQLEVEWNGADFISKIN